MPEVPVKTRRKLLKWLLILSGSVAALFAVLLAVAAVVLPKKFPPERLRAIATEKLSVQLDRKVEVGEVRFDIWRGFEIQGLTIANRKGEAWTKKPFIQVGALSISYRLLPLLWGQVRLGEVRLERPRVLVERVSMEEFNFSDLIGGGEGKDGAAAPKAEEGKGPGRTALLVTVDSVRLVDGDVTYQDRSVRPERVFRFRDFDFQVQNISLTGGTTRLSFDTPIQYAGAEYRLKGSGSYKLFLSKGRVKDLVLKGDFSGAEFEVQGDVANLTGDPAPALKGRAGLDASILPALIPPTAPKLPEKLSLSGPVMFTFETGGSLKKGLEVSGLLDGEKTQIRFGDLFLKSSGTVLKGEFKSVTGTDYLKVPSFRFVLQDWTLEGNFSLAGLPPHPSVPANPSFDFKAKADKLPLSGLSQAVPLLADYKFSGTVDLDVKASGRTRDPKTQKLAGRVLFRDIGAVHASKAPVLGDFNGRVDLSETRFAVPSLTFKMLGSPTTVTASLSNFHVSEFADFEKTKAKAAFTLTSDDVNLENLLAVMPKDAKKDGKKDEKKDQRPEAKTTAGGSGIPPGFTLSGTMDFKSFYFRKLALRRARAECTLAHRVLKTKASVQGFEGTAQAAYDADLGSKSRPFAFSLVLKGVSAQAAVNDAVDSFVKKNPAQYKDKIHGNLDFRFAGKGMGVEASAVRKSLQGKGDFAVTNVRIQGLALLGGLFKSLKEKSNALKMERLDGILEIRDERVILDAQSVGSTGRLRVAGAIGFDGKYAPSLRIENDIQKEYLDSEHVFGQLPGNLAGKVDLSRAADAQGYVPVDFKLTGNVSDPPGPGALDLTRLVKNVQASYAREVQKKAEEEIKNKLKGLFGK